MVDEYEVNEYGAFVQWRGQTAKNSEKSRPQCHFVHHRFHMDCCGIEAGSL